ncbi:MAG TPA: PBP1A family penicillin-binding protein [bacterium]|nr:PBP1A family penicillin-binding protein [bacterium]
MIYTNQNWKKEALKRKKNILTKYKPAIEKNSSHGSFFSKKNRPKKILKPLIKLAFLIGFIALVSLAGAFFWFSKELPKSTELLTKQPLPSTKIYDRTGQILLNDANSDFKRIKISLNELPEYVKWSTIVAEDRTFYSHHGINFRGLIRAIFVNIITGGSKSQGGSSISQQFIKNALLSSEKTYSRKIKEAILTWQLERKFSKDEILEMYFNEIPYGGTAYGIEAASEKYFNKSAKDLTLAEAATLAAIPQAPSYYSPYGSHKDKLLARKDWVLNSLAEEGYISQEKADEAKKQNLEFSNISSAIMAPHFVFYVRDLIAQKYGDQALEEGGLKIITTLDMEQQKNAEQAIAENLEKNVTKYNAKNAALVAMNPKTGEITAMVGSTNYFDNDNDGAVNVAIRPRQPGSSFKPLVYALAFEKGYSPQTIVFDVITKFKAEPTDYTPHNYSEHYFGPVSMKKALAGSLNVPAVKTMYLVGVDNILNLIEKMGYTTFNDRSRFGLSIVLGGGEVKLLEHVAGYASFANNGEYHAPMAILKVEDKDGKNLEENKPEDNRAKKIFKPQTVKLLNNVLSDNNERAYVFGQSNYLTLDSRPVAAKTGTTNDYKDAWTVGYTPSLVAGVWVGNTRGEAMKTSADGSAVAAPIWNAFMKKTLENKPVENFMAPDSLSLPDKPMLNGKFFTEIKLKVDKLTGEALDFNNSGENVEERTYRLVHNILHYVNKNNPLSPAPEKPWEIDENYSNFEVPIEEWAKKNDYQTILDLPKGYEKYLNNEQTLEVINNQPATEITIVKPYNNEQIYEENFPYVLEATVDKAENYAKIDWYYKKMDNNNGNFIGYQSVNGKNNIYTWTDAPETGSYYIYAILSDKNNQTIKSSEIRVERK